MSDGVKVLVADPPWRHKDQLPGKGRGASKHYATMSLEEIVRYPLPDMAPDSVLMLWRVASMQREALSVLTGWGFQLKSEIVWDKRRKCKPCRGVGVVPVSRVHVKGEARVMRVCDACNGRGDKPWFGMGWQVRGAHETCLIATRGKNIRRNASIRSVFQARVPDNRHSAKPEKFFDLVEELYPGPYHELFARRQRDGWTCEGLEAWKGSA